MFGKVIEVNKNFVKVKIDMSVFYKIKSGEENEEDK